MRFDSNDPRLLCGVLRRPLVLSLAVGLVAATSASAALRPIHRDGARKRNRAFAPGRSRSRPRTARGLARVIVRLAAPPLAAWGSSTRSPAPRPRPDSTSAPPARARTSHSSAAPGRRRRPGARGDPAGAHPGALRDRARRLRGRAAGPLTADARSRSGRHRVYPSLTYTRTMDRGPSVIHATDLQAATGDKGQGIKIGVVDTGVDSSSPFLAPGRLRVPAGFPKGDKRHTTPKVIVARVFPGPVRDKLSNQAFDPTEPHGTHVSGIAAGDEGTSAPAGPDHPATANLSGVAPTRLDRQLPRLHGPDAVRPRGRHAGDHQRLRVGGRRRHERDQLLGRRAGDRPGERRDERGRAQHGARRSRPRDRLR